RSKAKLLEDLFPRRGSSKAVQPNHVAVPPHILPPSQRRASLDSQLRQMVWEDRSLVCLTLLLKEFPARHRNYSHRNAFLLQLLGRLKRRPKLRSRAHNQHIGRVSALLHDVGSVLHTFKDIVLFRVKQRQILPRQCEEGRALALQRQTPAG